jgi:hypothetical protein
VACIKDDDWAVKQAIFLIDITSQEWTREGFSAPQEAPWSIALMQRDFSRR